MIDRLPPGPAALGCLKPIESQLSGQAVNVGKCFLGGCSGLQGKGPGPIVDWHGGLRKQAYDGSILIKLPLLESASCRPCQQVGIHAARRDSRSQCIPQMTVKTRKRSRSRTPVVADCVSGLRSCSSSSSSVPNHFTTPWQTTMPRSFSIPAAPSSPHNIQSPSAVYAPVATQVMLLAQIVLEV